MLSRFTNVQVVVILWIVVHQDPLSLGLSRQEYWSGLPFPSPRVSREINKRQIVIGAIETEQHALVSPSMSSACLLSVEKL